MQIDIYTDGAYSSNNQKGGVSWAFISNNQLIKCDTISQINGSNNTAELSAVIIAFSCIKIPNIKIDLYTDSMYVVGCGWRNWERKRNQDLWIKFDEQIARLKELNVQIEVHHIRGHQTDNSEQTSWNNFVDFLAVFSSQL